MGLLRAQALLCLFAGACAAQLTVDQKINDFQHLASLYAKQYGPYEWKRDTQGFDLLDLTPWLAKVRASKDDLAFYDVMSEYVSSLNDAHDGYVVPSSFSAWLHFTVDIYDGKVLIDFVDRVRLPANEFPLKVGDEIVSLDGKSAEDWIRELTRYGIAANPLSTRRFAADLITFRPQQLIPRAVELGPFATVVTRNEHGVLSTHTVPWAKTGLPLRNVGPVPTPKSAPMRTNAAEADTEYMAPLRKLQNVALPTRPHTVLGFGDLFPIFDPPPGYTSRLPRSSADFFTSGTIQAGGYRIGFIRIPSYGPSNQTAALAQFRQEIAFFEQNTDGLIIDEMRNPGGSVAYLNTLVQSLMPNRFRTLGFELRATSQWVLAISSALESARAQNAPEHVIALLQQLLDNIATANSENRGRTGPIPLDDLSLDRGPATDSAGRTIAYTKPLMVLIDEMSASGGDAFPATIQDNGRGVLFGMRTMGAGGNVVRVDVGNYTEGFTYVTQSLMVRKDNVTVDGYPSTAYVENIGVHPEIVQDYMTRDNLMQGGRPFVDAFLAAMVEHIRKSQ
jgi:C-terminal processing protease CtpA/Prc